MKGQSHTGVGVLTSIDAGAASGAAELQNQHWPGLGSVQGRRDPLGPSLGWSEGSGLSLAHTSGLQNAQEMLRMYLNS